MKETQYDAFVRLSGLRVMEIESRLGVTNQFSKTCREGDIRLINRHALAAIRAGLPAWSPETDAICAAVRPVAEAVEAVIKPLSQRGRE